MWGPGPGPRPPGPLPRGPRGGGRGKGGKKRKKGGGLSFVGAFWEKLKKKPGRGVYLWMGGEGGPGKGPGAGAGIWGAGGKGAPGVWGSVRRLGGPPQRGENEKRSQKRV